MFGKGEHAFYVELGLDGVAQLHLGEGELLPHPITLALVGLPVDRTFVDERLIESIDPLSLLADGRLETAPKLASLTLTLLPDIENQFPEQAHVSSIWLKTLEHFDEQGLEPLLARLHPPTVAAMV